MVTCCKYLAVIALMLLNGCAAVPIISGLRELGVSADARQELLRNELRSFNRAFQAGKTEAVLGYVAKESEDLRLMLRDQMRNTRGKERVVEYEIDFIDFSEGAWEADVETTVRYFQVPYYIVKDRFEKQKWRFNASDGWKLVSREVEV